MTDSTEDDRRARAAPVRAFVHAGPIEIAYSRSGRGAPLLLIVPRGKARESLCRALAARFLVVTPELARQPVNASHECLREFIDGLGLVRPHCVVDGRLAATLLGFALGDPQRIGRLGILWRDSGATDRHDTVSSDRLLHSGHPLLLLRTHGPPSAREIAALGDFLAAASP